MNEPISQSHALELIVNNLSQPLFILISNVPVKLSNDLTEWAYCIEIGMKNGAFDAVLKKTVKPTHSVAANMSGVSKSNLAKDTKKTHTATTNKVSNKKKQMPC
ncbi:unnamed protein product [Victoria cruziana]